MGLRGSHGKKEGGQLRFCSDFLYLNAVTIKDACPIPRMDESLSKLGDTNSSPLWTCARPSGRSRCERRIERRPDSHEIGVVPVEEDALRLKQRDGHFSKTNGSGLDQSDDEVRDLVMCYVDDVVIATPTLEDQIVG